MPSMLLYSTSTIRLLLFFNEETVGSSKSSRPVILLNSCLGEGDERCKSRCIMRFSCGLGRRGICREGGRGERQDSASRATCQWVSAARLCLPAFPTAIIATHPTHKPQPPPFTLHLSSPGRLISRRRADATHLTGLCRACDAGRPSCYSYARRRCVRGRGIPISIAPRRIR